MAVHFHGAGDAEAAGKYSEAAADEAAEALAFSRSAKLYQVAIDLLPVDRAEGYKLRRKLGTALSNAGRGSEAARQYLAAAATAPVSEAHDLRTGAAMQFLISGHIDEGLDVFDGVLRVIGMRMPTTPQGALWSMLLRRALVRLRGIGFQRREPAEVLIEDIRRADICWTAAAGLSLVDYIRGADFSARCLLLSLRAGDPLRVVKALSWEACHTSVAGSSRRRRTVRLLRASQSLTRQLDDPYAKGFVALARGVTLYLAGRWKASCTCLRRAECLFRDGCKGVIWELDITHTFCLWSLLQMGSLPQLTRSHAILFRQAQERGDLYALMNLGTYIMAIVRAANDEPEAARQELTRITGRWSQRGFHVQHHNVLLARMALDLYEQRGDAAWDYISAQWPAYRVSLLMRVQQIRIDMLQLYARAALAASARSANPEPFLITAERQARRLERERARWSAGHASFVHAAVSLARGDADHALVLLNSAEKAYEASDMYGYVAATRCRKGKLLGGDEGRALVEESTSWMADQGIRNPVRMLAMLCPGFPD